VVNSEEHRDLSRVRVFAIGFTILCSYLAAIVHLAEGAAIPVTPFQVALIFSIPIFLITKLNDGQLFVRLFRFEYALNLFIIIILISLLYSPGRIDGTFYFIRYLVLIFFAYVVLNTEFRQKDIYVLLFLVAAVNVFTSVVSIREVILNPEVAAFNYLNQGLKLYRAAGSVYMDPNRYAASLFLPLAFTFTVFINKGESKKWRLLAAIFFGVMFVGLLTSYSRSGWVSVGAMLAVITLMTKRTGFVLLLVIPAFLVLLSIENYRVLILSVLERLLNIFAGSDDTSSGVRILLGLGGLGMFADSYMLGAGFRAFPVLFPNYFNGLKTAFIVEPHNIIYTIMAEIGIQGLIVSSVIAVFVIRVAYKAVKESKMYRESIINISLFASLIAYFIFYQFYGGGLFDDRVYMIVGLIFVMYYLRNGESKSSDKPELKPV
jgi:O-antigen ligase